MSAAPAPRSAAAPAEPDAAEELAGEIIAPVIYLPDQSQPPPTKRAVPWRGRPRVAEPYSVHMPRWRATPMLAEHVLDAAAAAGLSYGAFMRALCSPDGKPGPRSRRTGRSTLPQIDRALLCKWLAELGKLGSNHNQLAREKNTTGEEPELDEWRCIETEIQAIRRALMQALGYYAD
jgi:hypothetical protein